MTNQCGTYTGWTAHYRRGEKPCIDCTAARAAYDKRRRENPDVQRKQSALSKAEGRATTRLRNLYPDTWRALYNEEVAAIQDPDASASVT